MSWNVLGIALTVVFGCILLGLIVEIVYLLGCKKRRTCIRIDYGTCWKTTSTINPRSVSSVVTNQENIRTIAEPDLELGLNVSNDMVLKRLEEEEESVELELMRLHNLTGVPRFLFTIKEETIEDLESEDTTSLSDIPMPCSPLKCYLDNSDYYNYHHGFNPLFELSLESEFNRFRTSPPPKFKFLRDAEEKLHRRLIEDGQRKAQKNLDPIPETEVKDSPNSVSGAEERDKLLLRLMNKKEENFNNIFPKFSSSKAQVLPLASSPTPTLWSRA